MQSNSGNNLVVVNISKALLFAMFTLKSAADTPKDTSLFHTFLIHFSWRVK